MNPRLLPVFALALAACGTLAAASTFTKPIVLFVLTAGDGAGSTYH